MDKLLDCIKTKNVELKGIIKPSDLVIDEKVIKYCKENKCGQYGRNFMCPPNNIGLNIFKKSLEDYSYCIILLYEQEISKSKDKEEFYRAADALNHILLDIEKEFKSQGYNKTMALFAGNCRNCKPCKINEGYKKCPYPEKSRPSSESLGVDVIKPLENMGISIEFRQDKVTWVGMILV